MSNLIIVESPTKARTLSRFLGSDYRIEATMGHIRDLPENRLGIEIKIKNQKSKIKNEQYDFIPNYQIIPGKKTKVAELKKLIPGASSIILATDPDREGEAIAYHVEEILRNKNTASFKRIVFHEITESAIKEALTNPREIDMQLVSAQQARRFLDRLVGYKLSPLLWNKLGMRWLSAGRVQTAAVRLIVEREREIRAFKPEEFWVVDVELTKNQNAKIKNQNDVIQSFLTRLMEIDGKKAEIKNKETADKIVTDLKTASYEVTSVETKEARRYPSPPFTTSTLQQAASNKFGWSAKRTMRAAQGLYEEGFVTYHRTDSTNLAAQAVSAVRNFISNIYGVSYLPAVPKFYKTKSKVAQEAHEAIRPTNIKMLGNYDSKRLKKETIKNNQIKVMNENIGRDGELLYSLIWKRFVACQMNEAVFDQTQVIVNGKTYTNRHAAALSTVYVLKATGQKLKFPGWLTLYEKTDKSEEDIDLENQKNLPPLEKDEDLNFVNIFPLQKFTEPPARYTEASLIKILEEKGIGRPSTYAPIISTIQDRKYVEKIERKFHATDLGSAVVDFLVKNFPEIFDILFTAKMEDELDNIANGQILWKAVLNEFYAPFSSKLDQVFKTAERVKVDLGTTEEKCPQCGSNLIIRLSKYGKFLACPNFPKCKFTKNIIENAGIKCPQCGAEIIIKKTRRGKKFYGCSSYPKCTFAAWKKENIK